MEHDTRSHSAAGRPARAGAALAAAVIAALATAGAVEAQPAATEIQGKALPAAATEPAPTTTETTAEPAPPEDGAAKRAAEEEPVSQPAPTPSLRSSVNTKKAFFKGKRPVTFTYELSDEPAKAVEVRVELRRRGKHETIEGWTEKVRDAKTHSITWKGVSHGKLGKQGPYKFRAKVPTSSASTSSNKDGGKKPKPDEGDDFNFYLHRFPIAGKHDYGSKGSEFGAGRGGRSHQGQDVFSKCGTPMTAARGGEVQANQYHSAAGYYLVVDGAKTGVDYVYMHMKKRSDFKEGDKVKTGEEIGAVGDSGNASGCHLHFELWSKPGWYEGGKPYDPKKSLKSWDKFS